MTNNSAAAVFCWVIYFVGEKFLMIIITADTSISSLPRLLGGVEDEPKQPGSVGARSNVI